MRVFDNIDHEIRIQRVKMNSNKVWATVWKIIFLVCSIFFAIWLYINGFSDITLDPEKDSTQLLFWLIDKAIYVISIFFAAYWAQRLLHRNTVMRESISTRVRKYEEIMLSIFSIGADIEKAQDKDFPEKVDLMRQISNSISECKAISYAYDLPITQDLDALIREFRVFFNVSDKEWTLVDGLKSWGSKEEATDLAFCPILTQIQMIKLNIQDLIKIEYKNPNQRK